jgi:sugar/nucleoside kinase (ribokinase family)
MRPSPPDLVAVGAPLVDLIVPVDDRFLVEHAGGVKGDSRQVDRKEIGELLAAAGVRPLMRPGGSAANIAVGCARLGIRAAFMGCCGPDALGRFHRRALALAGCEARLTTHPSLPTGRVLAMVTPDGERTMRACLGAAGALPPRSFDAHTFSGVRLVVLEGYTCFRPVLLRAILRAARRALCPVALDLGSSQVVRRCRPLLDQILPEVAIVLANEHEARAYGSGSPEAFLDELATGSRIVVVKRGDRGALLGQGCVRVDVRSPPVEVADTTGAGDGWAAGFLAGFLGGLPLGPCAELGTRVGCEVVQVRGAHLPERRWRSIERLLARWRPGRPGSILGA